MKVTDILNRMKPRALARHEAEASQMGLSIESYLEQKIDADILDMNDMVQISGGVSIWPAGY